MTETIDFTMMYATHNAFRRDLRRLAAAASDRDGPGAVRAGWENFKAQLHLHHSVEDTHLWPRLQRAVTTPDDLALLQDMEAEHALIDPLLAAVDAALDSAPDRAPAAAPATGGAHIGATGGANALAEALDRLAAALGHHLEHEEEDALPLIQAELTPADWKAFANEMRRRQGVKGAAVYVPWILDGAPAEERRRFLGALPAPVTALNRLLWQPRYLRRRLWTS
ncbi:hemerythrin domain-containing protein [Streptacidiphilus cavernicola]|uniref:Hemerythrin domain-containing protein n=1 Tax=Streptacidiphilus cavernicola TaxID=3342716 RepID=A0ABV6VXN3_9ACTN